MAEKDENFTEKRKFFRHPISLPLEFKKVKAGKGKKAKTVNLSYGGLLFLSRSKIPVDENILISLPFKDRIFRVEGLVVRCEKDRDSRLFNIGVSFIKVTDAFKVKLVEQLHLIEEYRALRSIQLNRDVTLREASEDWIARYSEQFRRQYW